MRNRWLSGLLITGFVVAPLMAQEISFSSGTTLKQAITQADYCYVRVEQEPIVFKRGDLGSKVGELYLHVIETDYKRARELPVGRVFEIQKERRMFARNVLKFNDLSLHNMAVPWHSGSSFTPVQELTIEEFNDITEGQLSFSCSQQQKNRQF